MPLESIMGKNKTIKVDVLTRVEGEGGLYVKVIDREIKELRLNIFEPPRFFEAFLKGRLYHEVPDMVARICGICPVAYQMSAVHAIEKIFGLKVEGQLQELRRLIYCAEWIASHCLHIYFLSAPDFLGFESAVAMGKKYPETLQQALRLKKVGNELFSLLGGRPVHPISVRVGGFYKTPSKKELKAFLPELEDAFEDAIESIRWAINLDFPDISWDIEFVSLWNPEEYPMNEGRLRSSKGLDIDASEFNNFIQEFQEPYSNALPSRIKERGNYMVGPLARLNLNHDKLPDEIKAVLRKTGITFPITNTFMSIIARAIEVAYAFYEAVRIIKGYEEPPGPYVPFEPVEGEASWITEAPRGSLYHRYTMDKEGYVRGCNIIPPTSQNIKQIEEDLHRFLSMNINKPIGVLQRRCEMIIRSYDPCISCSTHFLKLRID